MADWMKTIGKFEALNSFANYSFENPEDIFPELSPEKSFYHATALGHPLMHKDACVRNDLEMDSKTKLMIVSGSNMSGKSTYLRTVGQPIDKGDIYSSLGSGMRIRNENLIFGTIELRSFYFPRTNRQVSPWNISLITNLRYKYNSSIISKPDFVQIN